ncbi:MmcQ/YjbR family DNA-binding protein [Roseivirga sp. BDSF3-8]|uniref:MmcQ/YjbR family DNA-binding protein n=1 Tax=Roseivirga sp. BDSF3-8 TaxID=3241598 RepID=UPI00353268B1
MDIESYREYCLSKPGVTESTPFGPDVLVFKVGGKMFSLTDIEQFESINLKCDPEEAVKLREEFPDAVMPGYHMSKKHWNTVHTRGQVPEHLLFKWTDDSYQLIVDSLPKKIREAL